MKVFWYDEIKIIQASKFRTKNETIMANMNKSDSKIDQQM